MRKKTIFVRNLYLLLTLFALVTSVPAVAGDGIVHRATGPSVAGEYIVRFADHVTDASAAAARISRRFNAELGHVYHSAFYGCSLSGLSANQAAALARHPDIARVEESGLYTARGAGSQGEAPWNLDRIDQRLLPLDGAYAWDFMGTDVPVYIVDTGIQESHVEFQGRARTAVNCTSETDADRNGHGTHVAGIVGGATWGVAKDARLVSVKVLDASGSGSLSQVLCGLEFVASSGGPGVASLAFGGSNSQALNEAVRIVVDSGIFVAAAAGSDSCIAGPAAIPGVLTPAASDAADKTGFVPAPRCVDLFAPGINVTSAWIGDDDATATLSGASMAIGHVAGAAAVWLEADPGLKPVDLEVDLIARATENRLIDPQGAPNLLLAKIPEVTPVINAISPEIARVGDTITLTGRGFDAFQSSSSRVLFSDGNFTWTGTLPETWRDDRIEIQVPTGDTINGEIVPFPSGAVNVQVQTATRVSTAVRLRLATLPGGGTLAFQELTQISNDMDVSSTLASPNHNSDPLHNKGRTKDAEVGDVDGDGLADIFDNNSNNIGNNTHGILRLNNGNKTFSAMWMEPLNASDVVGPFASTTPSGGNFVDATVSYDADFADIDNDGHLDVLHTATQGATNLVRVLMNNNPSPGKFQEDSGRIQSGALGNTGCPDDLDTGDLNCDGWRDFGITLRRAGACSIFSGDRSETRLFLNQGSSNPGTFNNPIVLNAPNPGDSAHDVFFADFNHDMAPDVVVVNEFGADSQLFLHNGNFGNPVFTQTSLFANFDGFSGEHGDFNGDGEMDFVLVGSAKASVFMNNGTNPVSFTETALPAPTSIAIYDAEIGDLDNDGDLDIVVGAIVQNADAAVRVWLNNGSGAFTNLGGATSFLPGVGPYERLSVDLLDIDNDNDLDLYITGADGQSVVPGGFGQVPNQLFENLINP